MIDSQMQCHSFLDSLLLLLFPVATVPKGKVLLPQQRPLTPGGEPVIPTSAAAAAASQSGDAAAVQQEDAASAAAAAAPSPSATVDGKCGPTGAPHPPSTDPHTTSTGVSSSVDFEKIYRFLCAVQKPSDQNHLTAMGESTRP